MNWLLRLFRRSKPLDEGALIDLVVSLGYVVMDDWENYNICREFDDTTCIASIARTSLGQFTSKDVKALIEGKLHE